MFDFDHVTWFLVFVRIGALLSVYPILSTQNFPVQLRIALSALVSFMVTPGMPATNCSSIWALMGLMFMEVSVGLLLGFIARLVFLGLEAAGTLIGTEMGLTLTSDFNPFAGAVASPPAMLMYLLAGMLLFSLDMHHWMLVGFQRSYALVPIGGAHLSAALFNAVISKTSQLFIIAVQMAAPVMAVSFIITLIFAVLGRAVPQMNAFSESLAVRVLACLAVFGLTCQLMAQHVTNYLRRLPDDVHSISRLLGGV